MDKPKGYKELGKLDQLIYDRDIAKCNDCNSILECKQDLLGIQPLIAQHTFDNKSTWKLITQECSYKPSKIYGTYEKTIRQQICTMLSDMQKDVANELYTSRNGFLYGAAGHGKSTIMKCLCKKLSERKVVTMFELAINIVNKLKDFDDNYNYIQFLQTVPVLFIDDFAREGLTTWTISQVWTPILQHRLDNNMPTYISSNYDLIELYKMIVDLRDEITADMFIDRIKGYLKVIKLHDMNYRLGG